MHRQTTFLLLISLLSLLLCQCNGKPQADTADSQPGASSYNWERDFGPGPFPNAVKGTPSPSVETVDGARLYTYPNWIVEVRDDSIIGEHIRYRAADEAEFRELPFIEAGYFVGIWGDYLLVDEGTGPEYRNLYVFDPATQKQRFAALYNGALVKENQLVIARPLEDEQVDPKPDCSALGDPPGGLSLGYMEVLEVDLSTLQEQKTGQILCYFRQ